MTRNTVTRQQEIKMNQKQSSGNTRDESTIKINETEMTIQDK